MSAFEPLSFKTATTISAQRIVYVSAAETVAVVTGVTVIPIGITTDTVLDTTNSIPVKVGGIAKLFFNDTVAAGGLVAGDSSGRGVAFTAVTTGTYFVGVLVGAAVAATGTIARVLINPGSRAIP